MSTRQYSFQLSNDLQKIVTITETDAALAVRVIFASDAIVQETIDTIPLAGEYEARADEHGLTIFYGHSARPPRPRQSRRY